MGAPPAAGHRADALLQHAHRRVPRGGHHRRDLGESPGALRGLRHAERRQGDLRRARPWSTSKIGSSRSMRSSACRTPTSTPPPSGCISPPPGSRVRRGAGREPRPRPRGRHHRPSEGHAADRRQAAAALAGRRLQEAGRQRHHGGRRLPRRCHRSAGIKLVVNERYADTGELASLACAVDRLDSDTVDLLRRSAVPQLRAARSGGEQGRFLGGRRFAALGAGQSHRARFRLLLARR